jgi:transcription initiation factor TFIIIB Brf1 subunit/transcription initiation factor TFIIB
MPLFTDDDIHSCPHEAHWIVIDEREGTEICENCALVVNEQFMQHLPQPPCSPTQIHSSLSERRITSDCFGGGGGAYHMNAYFIEKDVITSQPAALPSELKQQDVAKSARRSATYLTRDNSSNHGYSRREEEKIKTEEAIAEQILLEWTSKACMPDMLANAAMRIYKKIRIQQRACNNPKQMKNAWRQELLAYCIYESCRGEECPRTVNEIISLTKVPTRRMWFMIKLHGSSRPRSMQFVQIVGGLIARKSQELNLAHSDISRLHAMLLDSYGAAGHKPSVLAAALVRMHTRTRTRTCTTKQMNAGVEKRWTLSAICTAFDVSLTAVRILCARLTTTTCKGRSTAAVCLEASSS